MIKFLKMALFAISTSLFSLNAMAEAPASETAPMAAEKPAAVPAPATMPMKAEVKPMKKASNKGFYKHLMHANFMPNLMPKIMMDYKKHNNPLGLTKEQFKKLKNFHVKHVTKLQEMVNNVVALEDEARKMALEGKSAKEVAKVGQESIKLRAKIMNGKLKCRDFVRSVLTPEQFEKLAASYYKK